ncbi:acireductone dioxygenase [Gluconacetobacter azotocaptans]|uniref:Acireductone dioxygenase n=1 Tax=Gluconacetobacter azotocaptans TaxID=142834 RepID=A0A7W4PF67_9PROT|nr:cupin domain-containing protein [Gluconacetobacter azotocaptans]MBB2191503.1 acireductone dioxygenase [Gluconacetobacter azotocaptans]MBM9403029.1 acireductone dioxygenase [Gluconacetobacter azotocaptans]GBQ32812.1 dioxygenase [Gluconacetobacter azotocaptans DSM 13594]
MSRLTVYRDDSPGTIVRRTEDPAEIAAGLRGIGVRFERWDSPVVPPRDATPDEVLAVYRPYLDELMGETGAGSADVVRINAATPNLPALRDKFLSEHIHSEDEVRFFVHGWGNFVLHVGGHVYDVRCTEGDLISVPEGVPHWFDAGLEPDVVALRVFTDTTGWVARYTGDDIARQFPVT